jgi:hypothetical protein
VLTENISCTLPVSCSPTATMPHTSRKKKPSQRPKRIEVEDEDGWTHVGLSDAFKRLQNKPVVTGAGYNPSDPAPENPYNERTLITGTCEIVPGTSLESVKSALKKYENQWLASPAYKALEVSLKQCYRADREVKHAIIFGSSTMTGTVGGWIMRHDVALTQMAVFRSAVAILGNLPLLILANRL